MTETTTPERIELPGGWSLRFVKKTGWWFFYDEKNTRIFEYCQLEIVARQFAEAMRPTPSTVSGAAKPAPERGDVELVDGYWEAVRAHTLSQVEHGTSVVAKHIAGTKKDALLARLAALRAENATLRSTQAQGGDEVLREALQRISAATPRNTNTETAEQMRTWCKAVAETALAVSRLCASPTPPAPAAQAGMAEELATLRELYADVRADAAHANEQADHYAARADAALKELAAIRTHTGASAGGVVAVPEAFLRAVKELTDAVFDAGLTQPVTEPWLQVTRKWIALTTPATTTEEE